MEKAVFLFAIFFFIFTISGINAEELPSSIDWRNHDGEDWMTSVKDQGGCGSCWAFAAVGLVEAKYNIESENPNLDLNLSEQYLVSDCSDAGACFGGWSSSALRFLRDEGVPDEGCMPYIDGGGCVETNCSDCTYNPDNSDYSCSDVTCSDRCVDWQNRIVKINRTDFLYEPGNLVIKQLLQYGPVAAGMSMAGHFDEGIYYCSEDVSANHEIIIVGYNDDDNYWIIKNSWGDDFGPEHNGYFKVSYGNCNVGIDIDLASNNPSLESTPFEGCYDSDNGQDIDIAGYTVFNLGNQTFDYCISPTTVAERFCLGNEQSSSYLDCPEGKSCLYGKCIGCSNDIDCGSESVCQNGRCLGLCFDSDDNGTNNGLDKLTAGYVQLGSDEGTREWDSCSADLINTVEEKYCSTETMIGMLTQYCGEGFICQNGKCVQSGGECTTGQIQCIGQPGPDYYKKCMDCDGDGASEWCYRPNEGGESFRCGYENGIYVEDEVCQNGQCVSPDESCASLGHECGFLYLCGENNITYCGRCESGETCHYGECVPSGGDSCQSLGIECGVHNINGNTKNCGGCDDCNECTADFCNYVHDGEATCSHIPEYEGTACSNCGTNATSCVCHAGWCSDADNCFNECTPGENYCSDSRNLKVCGNYDYDSCYEYNWGGIGAGNVLCPFGEECSNGACVPCLKTCASEGFDCGTHNFCNQYVDCGTCGAEGTACSSGNCVDCTNWDCNTKGFTCGTHNICGESFDCGTCGEGMNCGRTEFCLTAGTGACVCVNSNNGGVSCKKGETVQIVGGQERCVPLPTPAPTPTPIPEELEDEAIGLSPQVNYEGPLMKLFKIVKDFFTRKTA